MKHTKKITFATYITLCRLILAPILVPFFIVHNLPSPHFLVTIGLSLMFIFFGFTDFLDGFFARKYGQETKLGATLDHLADKFLTFSAWIALVAIHRLSYVAAIVLIGREFFMMGLREVALENDMRLKVSSFGKLKTALHIALIVWLIFNSVQDNRWCYAFNMIEMILLTMSIIISWASALQYFFIFMNNLKSR